MPNPTPDADPTPEPNQAAASGAIPYANALDCVRTMLAQEGVGAFFAGVGQRSLYMGPLWAIQFALNGFITNAMLRRREEREE